MKTKQFFLLLISSVIVASVIDVQAQNPELEIVSGNTAKLKLTQDGSQGQSPATWVLNSDEIGFYLVHSQTNRFPFCIQPGTASESVVIKNDGVDGDIGFGGIPVSHDFEIIRANGATYSRINAGFVSFTASSSRTLKENILPYQVTDLLPKIYAVPVRKYNWKSIDGEDSNPDQDDHIGLIAEEFHTILGRGSDREINGQEIMMVLWMAVQELTKKTKKLEKEILVLKSAIK